MLRGGLGEIAVEVDLSLLRHDHTLAIALPLRLRGHTRSVDTSLTHDVATGQVVLVQRVDSVATLTDPALKLVTVSLVKGTPWLH